MPVAIGIDAFTAFERQLRTLCLTEFPCGRGSWRTLSDKSLPESRFTTTLKDVGAHKEQEETLEELISSTFSPYSVDYSWSSEAKQLRDIAVKSPWLISNQFILDHFKSLRIVDKNKNQFILDEAKVTVKVGMVTGIPMPPELQATEEQPEFPIVTRTYYVECMFLEDFQARVLTAQSKDVASLLTDKETGDLEKDSGPQLPSSDDVVEQTDSDEQCINTAEPVTNQDGPVTEGTFFTEADDEDQSDQQPPPSASNGTDHSGSPLPPLKLVPYRTEGLQWSEEGLEFTWEHELVIDDLPALKEFLKRGMAITVKEDKVLSVPAEEGEEKASEAGKKGEKGAGGGGGGHAKSAKTGKDSKNEKEKPKEKPGGGKGKKKKEPEIELIHSPPEVTVLGLYTVELSSFIDGEYSTEETCRCVGGSLDVGEEEEEQKKEEGSESKKDKKKKKESGDTSKAKKGKEVKDKDKDKGKKTGKPDKKDSKMKRSESQLSEDEDVQTPPPPLTVHLQVDLHRWLTARDSIPKPKEVQKPPEEDGGKSEAGGQTL
ncbi:uncharacterized protein [Asterias amurensis]|uniref:uncharacterized protein n=1 Tax=Asterias amurensis TaxID=7602 RepID=UPI003AB249A6